MHRSCSLESQPVMKRSMPRRVFRLVGFDSSQAAILRNSRTTSTPGKSSAQRSFCSGATQYTLSSLRIMPITGGFSGSGAEAWGGSTHFSLVGTVSVTDSVTDSDADADTVGHRIASSDDWLISGDTERRHCSKVAGVWSALRASRQYVAYRAFIDRSEYFCPSLSSFGWMKLHATPSTGSSHSGIVPSFP